MKFSDIHQKGQEPLNNSQTIQDQIKNKFPELEPFHSEKTRHICKVNEKISLVFNFFVRFFF